MPATLQPAEIFRELVARRMSWEQAQQALAEFFAQSGDNYGDPSQEANETLQRWVAQQMIPYDSNGNLLDAGTERQTDPRTAYLERLGLGGKVAYNPAEGYKAGLYEPLKDAYDVTGRIVGTSQSGTGTTPTFMEYLNNLGGLGQASTGYKASADAMKNIYAQSPEARSLSRTSYEPGKPQADVPGYQGNEDEMQTGGIEELQNLLQQALRTRYGTSGANWAASRVPQLQRAYYGQQATGSAGAATFLDWLKQNYKGYAF